MKKSYLLIFLILIGGIFLLMQNQPESNNTLPELKSTMPKQEVEAKASLSDPSISELILPADVSVTQNAWVVDEQALKVSDEKLAELIGSYNDNLADLEMRAMLEQQVAEISQTYKQQVLATVKNTLRLESEAEANLLTSE